MAVQGTGAKRLAGSARGARDVVARSKNIRVVSTHATVRQPERDPNPVEQMEQRLRASILSAAEAWATHAYLRSCALKLIEEYGTVEDALLACMYFITILEELEG